MISLPYTLVAIKVPYQITIHYFDKKLSQVENSLNLVGENIVKIKLL